MSSITIPDSYIKAAERAFHLNLPFALFAAPEAEHFSFYASRPDESGYNSINEHLFDRPTFFATRFASSLAAGVMVKAEMNADDVLSLPPDTHPWPAPEIRADITSTPYPLYYGQLRKIRKAISQRKLTKVVLSRRISFTTEANPIKAAAKYFESLPNTFRAVYFTQESGLWISATPEILMTAHEKDPGKEESELIFESMSLAGTRRSDIAESWDEKNNQEHNTVLSFINETLRKANLETEIKDAQCIPFGNIEHMCHRITAVGHTNVLELIDMLSPTPALAGFPIDKAVSFISENEIHNRHYYGGVIGFLDPSYIAAYVNIRCCLVSPRRDGTDISDVNIFSGGGIMKDSQAASEWREAAEKAIPLCSVLNQDVCESIRDIPGDWSAI